MTGIYEGKAFVTAEWKKALELTVNHWVGGSSPSRGASLVKKPRHCLGFFIGRSMTYTPRPDPLRPHLPIAGIRK